MWPSQWSMIIRLSNVEARSDARCLYRKTETVTSRMVEVSRRRKHALSRRVLRCWLSVDFVRGLSWILQLPTFVNSRPSVVRLCHLLWELAPAVPTVVFFRHLFLLRLAATRSKLFFAARPVDDGFCLVGCWHAGRTPCRKAVSSSLAVRVQMFFALAGSNTDTYAEWHHGSC